MTTEQKELLLKDLCAINSDRWMSLEDLPNEEWKVIEGFEDRYSVSNYGRIKTNSITYYIYGHLKTKEAHILKTIIRKDGYCKVNLGRSGKQKTLNLHRLVAMAFIPNPNELPCINHKDENPSNNVVDNLEWCTCSYNVKHAYGTGLSMPYWKGKKRDPLLIEKLRNTHIGKKQDKEWIQKRTGKQKGENHPYAKKVTQYDLQGNFIREYNLVKEAAEANGLKLNNVSACLRGKSKTSGGYIWKYANLK